MPERGTGRLRTATAARASPGSASPAPDAVRYVLQVEEGLPFNPRAIAARVDSVLGDERGWMSAGHSLARTDEPDEAELHIIVASPALTDQLCAPLDTGGRLSCRNGSNVVLNGWRWANGAPSYATKGLRAYRQYVTNHEVGHALGYPHELCPEPGALAPVMVQQTKGLGGCQANPWPSRTDNP